MTDQREPPAAGAPQGPVGGTLYTQEGSLFPTNETLFSHELPPFSHGRGDPFSFAHDMLMHDGRSREETSSSTSHFAIEDTRMHYRGGARPRVRSPDTEDEAFSPRSWSEGDDGSSFTSLEPPLTYQDPSFSSPTTTTRSCDSTPPLDIPSALSSLMSLTTSDYYPGPYPSGSSADLSSSPNCPRMSRSTSRTPTLLTELPDSLISPMRTPKPKRTTTRTSETPKAKTTSSSSYSRDSYSPTREEMERELEMKKKTCEVCGDVARSLHFGGLACDSCKAFFRRCVISSGYRDFVCSNGETCVITVANRRSCQACRFAGCLKAGMNMSLVQHDSKNSSSRQFSKVSDHPAFQHDAGANYAESNQRASTRLTQPSTRQESCSSTSSQLYDSASSYNYYDEQSSYNYPTFSDESDLDLSKYPYTASSSTANQNFPQPLFSEGKQRGAQAITREKQSLSRDKARHSTRGESTGKTLAISKRSLKEMKSYLGPQDYSEIKKLHSTYAKSFNNISIPLEDTVINENNLGVYYSYFVQSRAKFLIGIPLYKSLAAKDKKKILQVAVSMSTYIVAAQFADLDNHVIESKDAGEGLGCGVVMPISTIRQFLTNDQFVEVMMFFSNNSPLYSDMTVSILMQIMGLTYPEPELTDSVVVEAGRCHYGGLLSRYLTAIHGSDVGQQHFQTLLESQHEARRLAGMLQHLELIHQAPERDHSSIKKILGEGIRLVYDEAREGLSKSRQEQRPHDKYSSFHSEQSAEHGEYDAEVPRGEFSKYEMIEKTLKQLATCDDPAVLAEARRILPVDLLKKLSEQLDLPD